MTTVTILRAETAEDEYHDPKPTEWKPWRTFEDPEYEVLVAWSTPEEPLEVARNTVVTNRTVYMRGTEPTGILATDRAQIDGVQFAIDGTVSEWEHDGFVGAQFAVKASD